MSFSKKTWTSGMKVTIEDLNRLEAGIAEAILKSENNEWEILTGSCTITNPTANTDYIKEIEFSPHFSSSPVVGVFIGKGNNPQESSVSIKAVSAEGFSFVFRTTSSWYANSSNGNPWFKWIAIAPKTS